MARPKREYQGIPCPKCGKKGLKISDHPHAYGWKDSSKVSCRFCLVRYHRDKLDEWLSKQSKEND